MRASSTTDRARRGGLQVAALAFGLAFLTACSATSSSSAATGAAGTVSGDIPSFTGPWAAEFAAEYRNTDSDFVRLILANENITDQELAEVRDRFTECLSAYGFSDVSFEDDGAFGFDAPEGSDSDVVNDQVLMCSVESGESSVGALHSLVRRNPERLDESTIMAACLVRKDAVDPSYGAEEYARDLPGASFPYLAGSAGQAAFQQCSADPLGLFE